MSIHDLKQRMSDVPGIETLTMIMIAGRQNYGIAGKVVALDAAATDNEVEAAIRATMTSDAIAQIPAGTPVASAPATQEEGPELDPSQAGEANPERGTSPATIFGDVSILGAPPASITAQSTERTEGAAALMAAPSPSASLIPTVNVTATELETIKPETSPMSVTGAKFAGLNLKAQLNAVRSAMEASTAKMAQAIGEMQDAASRHGQLAETISSEAASLKADMAEFTNGGG
jgi:hypothetical protein